MKHAGSGLTEYTLCSLIIIGGSLIGLLRLKDNIDSLFSNMLAPPNKFSTSSTNLAPSSSKIKLFRSKQALIIKIPNSSTLNFEFSNNPAEIIRTNGANGTTEILANSLENFVRKLVAAEQISSEQASSIMQLANKAHHLATLQKELESYIEKNSNNRELIENSPITLDGKLYANVYDAAQAIGKTGNDDSENGPELQEFWNLFSTAYGDNYKLPQELKQILQYHATAISDTSDSLRVTLRNILIYKSGEPKDLKNIMADVIMHKESANICHLENANVDVKNRCVR